MKKTILTGIFLAKACLLFTMCDKEIINKDTLEQKYHVIKSMAEKEVCVNVADWRIIALGAKACGGPTEYMAYSSKMDTVAFLQKVKDYTFAQEEYNKSNGIYSDCSLTTRPLGVKCVEGKAKLIY